MCSRFIYPRDLKSCSFYRAMHFSAFARSCDRMPSVCPSVRPSVTLVICDHIDWKSWKLIAWAISPTSSLFAAKRRSTPRGTWRNFGETRGGVGKKWRAGEQKAAISLTRVKIEEKLLWTAYRNSPTLFQMVPSPTSYGPPFPKIGGLKLNYPLLSQDHVKLRTSNLTGIFTGPIRIKAH